MAPTKHLSTTLLLFLLAGSALSGAAAPSKVLLERVSALSLYAGRQTEARRSAPIPQLSCVGGSCGQAKPEVVQCRNVGSDGRDVQWQCSADLPDGVSFGTTTVSCEGFDHPNDPYILTGSCGVEYTLKGQSRSATYDSRYPQGSGHDSYYGHSGYYGRRSSGYQSSGGFSFWTIVVLAVLGLSLFGAARRSVQYGLGASHCGGGWGGGGWGGSGWGGGGWGGGGWGGYGRRYYGGGWGGFGTGALLGYMLAPRRYGYSGYGYGGGWGGGRGGYGRRSYGSHGGGMRMGGGGGGMRRATGFGGTRRR